MSNKQILTQQAQDIYPFEYSTDQKLFTKITQELRCSVCQNQNLTDSMAPLAVGLRQEIYQKIQSGYKEQEIIQFVTSRYGNFVLYRPTLQWSTALLWFGPLLLLMVGLIIFKRTICR